MNQNLRHLLLCILPAVLNLEVSSCKNRHALSDPSEFVKVARNNTSTYKETVKLNTMHSINRDSEVEATFHRAFDNSSAPEIDPDSMSISFKNLTIQECETLKLQLFDSGISCQKIVSRPQNLIDFLPKFAQATIGSFFDPEDSKDGTYSTHCLGAAYEFVRNPSSDSADIYYLNPLSAEDVLISDDFLKTVSKYKMTKNIFQQLAGKARVGDLILIMNSIGYPVHAGVYIDGDVVFELVGLTQSSDSPIKYPYRLTTFSRFIRPYYTPDTTVLLKRRMPNKELPDPENLRSRYSLGRYQLIKKHFYEIDSKTGYWRFSSRK